MGEWLTRSFQEHSILWLMLSSVIGGVIGATVKFLFEGVLPQRLIQKREIIAVKRKYSTPILLAADELRDRMQNMIRLIDPIERENWLPSTDLTGYYYLSTLFTVARFIGWQRILRREVVYLDFTTTTETKTFEDFMTAIRRGFTDPALLGERHVSAPEETDDKWVYSFWFQGIGDSMILQEGTKSFTMNYASFIRLLRGPRQPDLKYWLAELGHIFTDLKATDIRFRRIVAIHAMLNAFINHSDPKHLRTEKQPYHWELLLPTEEATIREKIRTISPAALNEA
jgi:hypothetical protein